MANPSDIARRDFIQAAAGVIGLASAQSLNAQSMSAQSSPQTHGTAFVLSLPERDRAFAMITDVFSPFLGEWIGSRDGRDTGAPGPVLFTKRYSHYLGGPQMVAEVEAIVDGVTVFAAAKHYVYSPERDTLLTYFFEGGGNVQIFELDRKRVGDGKLYWQEILRGGPQFRVEETLPHNGEWSSSVFMQNAAGNYEVFAKNVLRRKWKEADRRKSHATQ